MDELLLKLFYEKHPFIKDNGARSSVTDKLVAEEFYKIGYNKAIDDVMERAKEIQEEQIKNLEHSTMRSGKQWAMYMNTYLGHIQVACKRLIKEQMKAK